MMKRYLLFWALFVAVANHKSMSKFLNLVTHDYASSHEYLYSNGSGNFFISEIYLKSTDDYDRGFEQVSYLYKQYRAKHKEDTTPLYRNFRMELWKFWNWRRYAISKCYRLPYKREIPLEYRNTGSYRINN